MLIEQLEPAQEDDAGRHGPDQQQIDRIKETLADAATTRAEY